MAKLLRGVAISLRGVAVSMRGVAIPFRGVAMSLRGVAMSFRGGRGVATVLRVSSELRSCSDSGSPPRAELSLFFRMDFFLVSPSTVKGPVCPSIIDSLDGVAFLLPLPEIFLPAYA